MSRLQLSASAGSERRGFALIIVMALVALLVMVLVSLATLTRVETQVGANSLRLAQAQQNARFALGQALGELQRHAGPDARITARAEIAGVTNSNRHWTGVWNAANGAALAWLVSGNENGTTAFDPTTSSVGGLDTSSSALSDVSIDVKPARVLVGPNTADNVDAANFVVAPLIDLEGPVAGESGERPVGRYAWWVGDEGVKANVADTDRRAAVTFSPYSDTNAQTVLAQQAQPRVRIEPVYGLPDSWYDSSRADLLANSVLMPSQLSYLAGGPDVSARRNGFHDATVYSKGILVDTTTGALRYDLSLLSSGPAGTETALAYLNARPLNVGLPARYAETPSFVSTSSGALASSRFHIRPVLTAVWISMALTLPEPSALDRTIPASWELSVELWNPYNAELSVGDHRISLSQLPTVRIRDTPSSVVVTGNWARSMNGSSSVLQINVPSTAFQSAAGEAGVMQPGQLVRYSVSGNGLLRNGSGSLQFPSYPPDSEFYLNHTTTSASRTRSVLLNAAGATMSTHTVPAANLSVPGLLQGSVAYATFCYRLDDSTGWLGRFDPRSASLSSTGLSNLSAATLEKVAMSDGRVLGVVALPARPVYELPVQSAVSVGELSQLVLGSSGQGGLGVGSPAAGSANRVFDRFFLSTLPNGTVSWDPASGAPLPSTHLEVFNQNSGGAGTLASLQSTANDRRAANFLIRGSFNVNSTSIAAWRALLGGTDLASWRYVEDAVGTWSPESSPVTLGHAFFTRPHSAQFVGTALGSADEWKSGFYLLDQNTDANALAEAIVDRIKTQGPFRSVEAFASSGLVDDAINDAIDQQSVDLAAPGRLRQSDLLRAWAPILAARSDTFIIRAYGETVNPLIDDPDDPNYVQARAWCEAVLQRTPVPVEDPDDPNEIIQPTGPFGRRFVITSFRWLSPDDI